MKTWNDLPPFFQNIQFNVDVTESLISVYKMGGIPPKVSFAVSLDTTFKIVCYNH